jgi:ferrochelatase
MIDPTKKTAVVLFNLGGPDSLENVKSFLFNLFNDPAIIGLPNPFRWLLAKLISGKRESKAQAIYAQMGNGSPIVSNTQAQANALEKKLTQHGKVKVFVCMRYWHPMTQEMVDQVKDYQPDNIILLPLYPQFSTTTTGSSVKEWVKHAANKLKNIPTHTVCCYPTQKHWVHAVTGLIQNAYSQVPVPPRILFSAHGLPEKIIAKGDPYQWQVEQTTQAIIAQLAIDGLDYVNCYQSRVGPLKWIGPSTEEEIKRAGDDKKPIVLVPIAFVSEHSETLVELDIEYKELADHHGVPDYIRVPTVSVDEHYIEALADMCLNVPKESKFCSDTHQRICPKEFGQCPMKHAV